MNQNRNASQSITLQCKEKEVCKVDRMGNPGAGKRCRTGRVLRLASFMGMDQPARRALKVLLDVADGQRVAVAGRFMPDTGVSGLLAARGIMEGVEAADGCFQGEVFAPYTGQRARVRSEWADAGRHVNERTVSLRVLEAQQALDRMARRGQMGLVIGCHDEAESEAICGSGMATRIIETTSDTARLRYAPAFGVVTHTQMSERKVKWLLEQLRLRYRDARITFAKTISDGMSQRLRSLEKLLPGADHVVIVGDPGEVSCESLKEEAWRQGKPATIVRGPEECGVGVVPGRTVVLTAGAYALDEKVVAVARALVGKK